MWMKASSDNFWPPAFKPPHLILNRAHWALPTFQIHEKMRKKCTTAFHIIIVRKKYCTYVKYFWKLDLINVYNSLGNYVLDKIRKIAISEYPLFLSYTTMPNSILKIFATSVSNVLIPSSPFGFPISLSLFFFLARRKNSSCNKTTDPWCMMLFLEHQY